MEKQVQKKRENQSQRAQLESALDHDASQPEPKSIKSTQHVSVCVRAGLEPATSPRQTSRLCRSSSIHVGSLDSVMLVTRRGRADKGGRVIIGVQGKKHSRNETKVLSMGIPEKASSQLVCIPPGCSSRSASSRFGSCSSPCARSSIWCRPGRVRDGPFSAVSSRRR